jgi:hypothetical protein
MNWFFNKRQTVTCSHRWYYAGPITGPSWKYRWKCTECGDEIIKSFGMLGCSEIKALTDIDYAPYATGVEARLRRLECGERGHKMKLHNISRGDTFWRCDNNCGHVETVQLADTTPNQMACIEDAVRNVRLARKGKKK